MAHISLYRRFRPSTFDEMVRQEHVVRVLKNQIEQNAAGHAYLFCGPRGTGKTSVARIFARAVNCEQPVNGSPCGKCAACRAIAEGSLDVTEIDAASNNGVNEMRDLREKVQYPPVTGRYKVYIIDEVHMLTDSAFNALLKTLEEPPAHAIFILATTEPHKIPATILSRCMRLDFKLIPAEDLEKHLTSVLEAIGKEYEPEAVSAIARAGAGSDRDMLSIAETCIAYDDKLTYAAVTAALGAADFKTTARLTEAMLHGDMPTALFATETALSEGKAVGVLVRDLMELLSQVTIAMTCKNAQKLLALPKDLFERVKLIADNADGRAVLRATELLGKTETEMRFASSPRILLETAIMRISMPETELSAEALTVRLNELERRVAGIPMPLAGGAVDIPVEEPAPKPAPKKVKQAPPEEVPPEYDYDEPPPLEEEPVFDDAFPEPPFSAPAPAPAPKAEPKAVPVAPIADNGEKPTAEVAFGRFLRTLRKTSRNGVLFTMCSDLIPSYEGDTLVLVTDVETIARSLQKEEHRAVMADTFALVGITSFEVRGAQPQAKSEDAITELKKNFSKYPVEVK
ncbi:MAG: DNA polymerase III subunit gamma/tau [Clostridia bacterium]|nr:DNA polymerase III subunit gamma/tau [Clostridia bacterium]